MGRAGQRQERPGAWSGGGSGRLGLHLLLTVAIAACGGAEATSPRLGGAPPPAAASPSTDARAATAQKKGPSGDAPLTPSWLIPEVEDASSAAAVVGEPGARRLLGVLRVRVRPDGSVERAAELFPAGRVTVVVLPPHFDDRFLFVQSDADDTALWMAPRWLAPLRPLAAVDLGVSEVIPGFDRLYLRARSGRIFAVDPESGDIMPRGPLPRASKWGAMAFADGWRAVVDTGLRGALATYDAGASWHPVPLPDGAVVRAARVRDANPVVSTPSSGTYEVDAMGHVRRLDEGAGGGGSDADDAAPNGAAPPVPGTMDEHPLGRRPLRRIIEHGWPVTSRQAIVLYGGGLTRVMLPHGRVMAHRPRVLAEPDASCAGVPVGDGFGFVCGGTATTIYRYREPLTLEPVARFNRPRMVHAGGNGAFAVRGSCRDEDIEPNPELRTYCVVDREGRTREVAVRGDLGAERVVPLRDGRTVILTPPRLGEPGRVATIDGASIRSQTLRYAKAGAEDAVVVARRGLWLTSFAERSPGKLHGWVEAGGPVLGVEVDVATGTVRLGEVVDVEGPTFFGGHYALSLSEFESAKESVDGGFTWRDFQVPRLAETRDAVGEGRGCTIVGCIFPGWLRLGWGKAAAAEDLTVVAAPRTVAVPSVVRSRAVFDCDPVDDRFPGPDAANEARRVRRGRVTGNDGWAGLLGGAGPPLGRDDVGVQVQASGLGVYAWGPRGADWTTTGRWQIQFENPFVLGGSVRTAETRSPWPDADEAEFGLGRPRGGSRLRRWSALLDPGGNHGVATLCFGTECQLYRLGAGDPLTRLQTPTGRRVFRRPSGVVRVGDSLYLHEARGGALGPRIWRSRQGRLAPWAELRPGVNGGGRGRVAPRLVRRAFGAQLGVLVVEPADPADGHTVGRWLVFPVDAGDRTLAAPIDLGPVDLAGSPPRACADDEDGWLIRADDVPIRLRRTAGYVAGADLLLRVSGDRACAVAMVASTRNPLVRRAAPRRPRGTPRNGLTEGGSVPLIIQHDGRYVRYPYTCQARRPPSP